MTIQHHLGDEILLEYASGALSEGWSLAVASHMALCPSCRRRLSVLEQAGGIMIKQIECADAATDQAWDSMRARLADEGGARTETPATEVTSATGQARGKSVLPEPLRSYVGGDVDALKWKALGRSASHVMVTTGDPSTRVRLLRIPGGKPVPEHSHGGRELTLVLAGSYMDGDQRFGRGDLEEADEEVMHQPIADDGEDCICVVVTDAPIRFKNWFFQLLQPALKI
ncbi:ChrR family anti-sigma-E factor [Agrobacterium sp. ES01]|uniref:ChrR family anti-sigma-E factor n=1 Tax=Agrobacterium sp. ES01 TaxID=3420714 RepID=UPI003D0CFBCB